MVRFEGTLKGEAERRFFQKVRGYERTILLLSYAVVALIWIFCTYHTTLFEITIQILLVAPVLILLGVLIPKSKKEKDLLIPKSVVIDGECIVAIYEKGEKRCAIAKVKEVQDCKTYYELVLPFYKIGFVLICQKDCLVQGTLEDFEIIFEDKMSNMTEFFD